MDIVYIDKYEIQEERKFRYGIPAYTGPFRALVEITVNKSKSQFLPET
jgi:hypothetical protein